MVTRMEASQSDGGLIPRGGYTVGDLHTSGSTEFGWEKIKIHQVPKHKMCIYWAPANIYRAFTLHADLYVL